MHTKCTKRRPSDSTPRPVARHDGAGLPGLRRFFDEGAGGGRTPGIVLFQRNTMRLDLSGPLSRKKLVFLGKVL